MKVKYTRHSGFTMVELLVVILIVVALVAIAAPVILKQKRAADQTTALSNIRQIGLSLFEFDSEYGSFPDDKTALDVIKKNPGSKMNFGGGYSNDYFRQLIVYGLKSEKPFWCKTSFSPREPDDVFNLPAKALEAGEVGYSYIMMTATDGQKSSGDPGRPVVVAPSFEARNDWTFDPVVYGGRAVILKLDNSATALSIRADNKYVTIGSGRRLQDTGKDTPWGTGINPVLRAPQPRGR